MLPVMLMLLFVYLFGGAIDTGTAYVTYVVPGVLLLCAGFGAAHDRGQRDHDMTGGIIDRFRSMDVGGSRSWPGTSWPAWSATSSPPPWSSGWRS